MVRQPGRRDRLIRKNASAAARQSFTAVHSISYRRLRSVSGSCIWSSMT